MGHSQSSSKREIHNIKGLPQKIRKLSNKQSKPTPNGTIKSTTNKAQENK